MPQHFLLTSAARTLSLASVMRMSDEEVERVFIRLRWSDNNGEALLPALRLPHCLGVPPSRARSPLALQSLPEGFQRHVGHAVRVSQDAAEGLLACHRNFLQ